MTDPACDYCGDPITGPELTMTVRVRGAVEHWRLCSQRCLRDAEHLVLELLAAKTDPRTMTFGDGNAVAAASEVDEFIESLQRDPVWRRIV